MYRFYNTRSNFKILLELLAKELGLLITPCEGTFRQAASYIGQLIGKPGTVKVQLDNGLELAMGRIRVMAAADSKLQFVLGTDLFAPAGTKLQDELV